MIIVGLGNKGESYSSTRHNVGYMFLDFMIEQYDYPGKVLLNKGKLSFEYNKYTGCFELKVSEGEIILLKPNCFMNESGIHIKKAKNYYSVSNEKIIVVHDDLDVSFGRFLVQKGIGPHIHNGISSIEQSIGKDFWRVRIGIDNREVPRTPGRDYVLQNFSSEELKQLPRVFEECYREISTLLK